MYTRIGERHDVSQAKTAVHDIWLLSMADRAVISAFSTFGYIGISLYTYIIYNYNTLTYIYSIILIYLYSDGLKGRTNGVYVHRVTYTTRVLYAYIT